MGTTRSTVKICQKPPKEVIQEVRPETLKEFMQLATERNRRRKKQSITIRVSQDVLESYKTMGNGYTAIMADVLAYAVNNPAVLTEATK